MAGKKDYFGIAISGFRHASRGNERNDETLSLYDQLKKFGTAEEKNSIRRMESSKRETPQFDRRPEVNPYA